MSLNGSHPALHPALAKALADRGYANLTPVQEAMLPADPANTDLLSRDLLVSAKTGSGKIKSFGPFGPKYEVGHALR